MLATDDKAWGRAMMDRGFTIVHESAAAVWHERHSVIHANRRERAVMKGFAIMFPEMERGVTPQLVAAGKAVWRAVRRHAVNREPSAVWRDLRRAPASIAAVLAGFTRGARR